MMDDQQLDLVLAAMGRARMAVADPPALHERAMAVPLVTQRRIGSLPRFAGRFQSLFSATRLVIAGAIVALFGGLLLVAQPLDRAPMPGAEKQGLAPLTGPAGNGLIAFARDGDIFIGDPVTGDSEAIITGPEYDMEPAFSPDGSRLAFIRYEEDPTALVGPWPSGSLVVVRPDGSDERVVGRARPALLWAPDGRSLVQYDEPSPGGTLTLLDATGVAPPRIVTLPTMDLSCCGFRYSHVATFMRPPLGDRILAWAEDYGPWYLDVVDADGSDATRLIDEAWLTDHGFEGVWQPKWSPDGSMIAFATSADDQSRIAVIDADGDDPRDVGEGWVAEWSPDGARIMSQRSCDEAEDCVSRLTIIDVATGTERDLPVTTDLGWSGWSPDGASILYTSGDRGRVYTVDVETGEVTELPWESDARYPGPSWQRVAGD